MPGLQPWLVCWIDGQVLGHIELNSQSDRLWLEHLHLIHTIVQERLEQEINVHTNTSCVVLVIPLLLETELEKLCSEAWAVSCSDKQP